MGRCKWRRTDEQGFAAGEALGGEIGKGAVGLSVDPGGMRQLVCRRVGEGMGAYALRERRSCGLTMTSVVSSWISEIS